MFLPEMAVLSPAYVALFVLHLLAVNLASVTPLVCVWLEGGAARGDTAAQRLARSLSWHGVAALLVGGAAGLALGWLVWDPHYATAVGQLGSRLPNGIAELLFSLVLMGLHAWWWSRPTSPGRKGRWGRGLLALLAGTNLLYHFPVLMVIFARLATGDDPTTSVLDSPAFRQRLVDPVVLARCVHVWLASVAVTGGWLLALSWSWQRQASDDVDAAAVARWGARLALIPTLLQIPSGIWLLTTLSPFVQSRLLGGDLSTTSAFGASVLLALWLMHCLAAIGFGETARPQLARALALLLAVVTLMTFVLRHLEVTSLELAR